MTLPHMLVSSSLLRKYFYVHPSMSSLKNWRQFYQKWLYQWKITLRFDRKWICDINSSDFGAWPN